STTMIAQTVPHPNVLASSQLPRIVLNGVSFNTSSFGIDHNVYCECALNAKELRPNLEFIINTIDPICKTSYMNFIDKNYLSSSSFSLIIDEKTDERQLIERIKEQYLELLKIGAISPEENSLLIQMLQNVSNGNLDFQNTVNALINSKKGSSNGLISYVSVSLLENSIHFWNSKSGKGGGTDSEFAEFICPWCIVLGLADLAGATYGMVEYALTTETDSNHEEYGNELLGAGLSSGAKTSLGRGLGFIRD
ncbi:MAG: hypothetical protein AAFN81_00920, partial [Bacteroidota bacterium]